MSFDRFKKKALNRVFKNLTFQFLIIFSYFTRSLTLIQIIYQDLKVTPPLAPTPPSAPSSSSSSSSSLTETDNIPEEFLDPITNEIMKYPLILPSGNTVDST